MLEVRLKHMRSAVRLAKFALDHGETPVACVFVHEPSGQVVAYGMNYTNESLSGIAHAEFMGIEQLRERFGGGEELMCVMRDVVVYVTVEPCVMCASALKQLEVGKVVFGCANERFGGNGTVIRVNGDRCTGGRGYVAVPGILRREAIMLLRYFYVRSNERAPKPRNKAERRLDRNAFPSLPWSRYIGRESFVEEFGEKMLCHFDDSTDIFGDLVDWDLIDEPCDWILEHLKTQCQEFALHRRKKIKLEV
ncbi:hypothetical protein HG536_0E03990 [Torulaspora globosa]|uniref:tRNA(adenine(34)) deaminase n=1 Tax=Torulaspora globosa TaxID=48254 RepID=A0A7G3ZJ02_9SACH|nr:uncharacterized protein HG536_0E03990 [Torulaspora globosa]QLL33488.1 hypothetical protein HG536_0E03990 [Torulaspora globosa]